MSADTIERIQMKIAYLERANNDLSDTVFRQQQEIQNLGARLKMVAERFEAAQSEAGVSAAQDERPPHF